MKLDHVVLAVGDLAAAGRELEARHGLVSVPGGRHPGWGTENRIVPLGDSYLELIAVADETEAAASAFGRWVAAAQGVGSPQPLAWAVRPDDLERVARRLELPVADGSRQTADGAVLRWRFAGLEHAMARPCLPFFIEWAPESPFPGRAGPAGFSVAELRLEGDPEELRAWLGAHDLPLVVEPGTPALTAIGLDGPGGSVVISGGS